MLIQSEFDIRFGLPEETSLVALLHLHPSLSSALRSGDDLRVEHTANGMTRGICFSEFFDGFGNRCSRITVPAGQMRLSGSSVIEIDDAPDPQLQDAQQLPVQDLPNAVLQYLLASRYCEVDRMGGIAYDLFGWTKPGWERAAAIRDWVHNRVQFDYKKARPTKTAMDVFTEREGVCRDFQHLAVTLTRSMNIPTRYVTGYLGDIRVPAGGPGDFSAWYQVYLDGEWRNMDARHNVPRVGRVLMAVGRDAADVALTTSFGVANLEHFHVESKEIHADGTRVSLPATQTQPTVV